MQTERTKATNKTPQHRLLFEIDRTSRKTTTLQTRMGSITVAMYRVHVCGVHATYSPSRSRRALEPMQTTRTTVSRIAPGLGLTTTTDALEESCCSRCLCHVIAAKRRFGPSRAMGRVPPWPYTPRTGPHTLNREFTRTLAEQNRTERIFCLSRPGMTVRGSYRFIDQETSTCTNRSQLQCNYDRCSQPLRPPQIESNV